MFSADGSTSLRRGSGSTAASFSITGTGRIAVPLLRGAGSAGGISISGTGSGVRSGTRVPQTGQSGRPDDVHPVPHFAHFTIHGSPRTYGPKIPGGGKCDCGR